MQLYSVQNPAENKLLILYILNKLNFELTNSQIARIVINTTETNYFYIQQYLSELVGDKFIEYRVENGKRFYKITPSGKQALDFFKTMLRASIRKKIDHIIKEKIPALRTETQVAADYIPLENDDGYMVSCRISEGSTILIDLKIYAGTKEQARVLCRNWENNAQEIYSEIIHLMTNCIIK